MPSRALRPCPARGCAKLVRKGRCPEHTREHHAMDRSSRGTAAQRGYDARHRRWREHVLARDPLCVDCKAEGRVTPSVIADHVLAVNDGGEPYDLDNGQGLCVAHHNAKIVRETKARRALGHRTGGGGSQSLESAQTETAPTHRARARELNSPAAQFA